jgi:photosystem II stability/assembly factor-like uncharacterized protein
MKSFIVFACILAFSFGCLHARAQSPRPWEQTWKLKSTLRKPKVEGSWDSLPTGCSAFFEHMSFATPDTGVILGYTKTREIVPEDWVMVTYDGAKHWQRIALLPDKKNFPGVTDWSDVIMADSKTIFLRSYWSQSIFRSTDFGRSWKRCNIDFPQSASRVRWTFPAPQEGFIMVGDDSMPGYVARSTDGGLNWQEMKIPAESAHGPTSMVFVSPTVGYLDYRRDPKSKNPDKDSCLECIFRTSNGGASWTLDTEIAIPPYQFERYSFLDGTTIILNSAKKDSLCAPWSIDSQLNGGTMRVTELRDRRAYYAEGGDIWMIDLHQFNPPILFCWPSDVLSGRVEFQLKWDNTLMNIQFVTSDIGYAIGADGMVFKTIHRGQKWPN